jgi:Uncharacterized alpha/beta hydrolase domain (DUF2235)
MALARNLIVCADGTWNSPYTRDRGVYATSNVFKLVKALRHGYLADVETEQHVFYDQGVGTGDWLDRLVGGATGAGLERNVLDGYQFLVDTYEPGDRLFLVGFSRGAYTVRRLTGFLNRFGLVDRKPYGPDGRAALDQAIATLFEEFQRTTSETPLPDRDEVRHYPDVEALGVWDTVGAMGLPDHWLLSALLKFSRRRHQFVDQHLSRNVRHAYHALALDEPRRVFAPTLWEELLAGSSQHLEQVWFAGAHANVGGGYQEAGLSDTALQWMIERLRPHGVYFRDAEYVQWAVRPDCYGEARNPRESWLARLLYPTAGPRPLPARVVVHPSVFERGTPASLLRLDLTRLGQDVVRYAPVEVKPTGGPPPGNPPPDSPAPPLPDAPVAPPIGGPPPVSVDLGTGLSTNAPAAGKDEPEPPAA